MFKFRVRSVTNINNQQKAWIKVLKIKYMFHSSAMSLQILNPSLFQGVSGNCSLTLRGSMDGRLTQLSQADRYK